MHGCVPGLVFISVHQHIKLSFQVPTSSIAIATLWKLLHVASHFSFHLLFTFHETVHFHGKKFQKLCQRVMVAKNIKTWPVQKLKITIEEKICADLWNVWLWLDLISPPTLHLFVWYWLFLLLGSNFKHLLRQRFGMCTKGFAFRIFKL